MRIAVVGGGSTYTPELVEGLAFWQLRGGAHTVVLYDINASRLETVGRFSQKLARAMNSDLLVELTTDFDVAIKNATFVIFQIRIGGQQARHDDILMATKEGVVAEETLGVGGLAMCLRTLPPILEMARKVRDINPKAWIINTTSPTGMITEAISRFATTRCVGLCNIPREFQMDMARHLRVEPERIELDWVGLNHLGWVRQIRVDGEDRLQSVLDSIAKNYGPRLAPGVDFPISLLRGLGMIPSQYLRYYYMTEEMVERESTARQTRAQEVMALEKELLDYYCREDTELKPVALSERGGTWTSRCVVEFMEALTQPEPRTLVLNTLNMGAINGLPGDSCVEIPATVNHRGVHPMAVGDLGEPIMGLVRHVKSYERMTLEAAISGDRRKALIALLNSPLVPSYGHAERLLKRLTRRGLL